MSVCGAVHARAHASVCSSPMQGEETKCMEEAVVVMVVVVLVVVVEGSGVDETSSSLQSPDGLAPQGLHPGTEQPLSG